MLGHPSFTRWPCTRPPTPASVLPLALRFLLWPQNAPSPRPQVPVGTAPASAVCQGGAWPAGADLLARPVRPVPRPELAGTQDC